MKKLLVLMTMLVLSTMNLDAQSVPSYEQAFQRIQKSSVIVYFNAIYQDEIVNLKTGEKKVITQRHRSRGTGVIVGKKSGTKGPHTYYVLTCRHILIAHRDKLGNPINDLSKAKSISIAIGRFTHKGAGEISLHVIDGYWMSPVEDAQLDFAILEFKSMEDLQVAKIYQGLPRNLYGKTGLSVAAAAGLVPVPVVLHLGANKPANAAPMYEFNFSGPTKAGMSGAGIFILHNNEWQLAGIVEAQYYGGGSFGFGIRIDIIIDMLKLSHKSHWLENK